MFKSKTIWDSVLCEDEDVSEDEDEDIVSTCDKDNSLIPTNNTQNKELFDKDNISLSDNKDILYNDNDNKIDEIVIEDTLLDKNIVISTLEPSGKNVTALWIKKTSNKKCNITKKCNIDNLSIILKNIDIITEEKKAKQYELWCKFYENHLSNMYGILIFETMSSNLIKFPSYDTFKLYIYNNSSSDYEFTQYP